MMDHVFYKLTAPLDSFTTVAFYRFTYLLNGLHFEGPLVVQVNVKVAL